MTYVVKLIEDLYDEAKQRFGEEDLPSRGDVLGEYLSTMEAQGFTLNAVIPDHRTWDDEGDFAGWIGAHLVLHGEGAPISPR